VVVLKVSTFSTT